MTDATFVLGDFTSFDRRPLSRRHSFGTILTAATAALSLVFGSWLLDSMRHPTSRAVPLAATVQRSSHPALARPVVRQTPEIPASAGRTVASVLDASLLGAGPLPLDRSPPLSAAFAWAAPLQRVAQAEAFVPLPPAQPSPVVIASVVDVPPPEPSPLAATPRVEPAPLVASVPLPEARPPDAVRPGNRWPARTAGRRTGRIETAAAGPRAPSDNRGFLEKFFGMLRPTGPTLAYAAPEDGLLGNGRGAIFNPALPHDRWTAVYDIAAHTVTLPDGTRLEAHSGLGDLIDDPRHVDARNRGATPPHLYDLEPRAQLFHGVQALRLNPVGGNGVFGRTGLLAHTYMLGPKGDSNGCVSFRDYKAFLQAYASGQVRRLAVVAGAG